MGTETSNKKIWQMNLLKKLMLVLTYQRTSQIRFHDISSQDKSSQDISSQDINSQDISSHP